MRIGIDVGSTTIKYVVMDDSEKIIHQSYERHLSQITEKTLGVLRTVRELTGEHVAGKRHKKNNRTTRHGKSDWERECDDGGKFFGW